MLDVVEEGQKVVPAWTGLIRYLHITPRLFLTLREMPEIQSTAGQELPGG